MGYPEGEGDNVDGKGSSSIDPETCVTLEVEIVADNWPQVKNGSTCPTECIIWPHES